MVAGTGAIYDLLTHSRGGVHLYIRKQVLGAALLYSLCILWLEVIGCVKSQIVVLDKIISKELCRLLTRQVAANHLVSDMVRLGQCSPNHIVVFQ